MKIKSLQTDNDMNNGTMFNLIGKERNRRGRKKQEKKETEAETEKYLFQVVA